MPKHDFIFVDESGDPGYSIGANGSGQASMFLETRLTHNYQNYRTTVLKSL